MTESEAFEHWIDTFDGELVVTNRLIWAAAWKAATKAEREACAKVCEQTGDTTGECPEMAGYCADAIRMRSNR